MGGGRDNTRGFTLEWLLQRYLRVLNPCHTQLQSIPAMLSARYNTGRGKRYLAPTPWPPARPQTRPGTKAAPGADTPTLDTSDARCVGKAGGWIGRGGDRPQERGRRRGEAGETRIIGEDTSRAAKEPLKHTRGRLHGT